MSKLATFLKEEIARLGRKEARRAALPLKRRLTALNKTVRQQRSQIGDLARRLEAVARARDKGASTAAVSRALAEGPEVRLGPRSIRSQRKRLRLTQAELAKLTGVTTVAVYFWESGKTRPRGRTAEALLSLRSLGVRDARQRLEDVAAKLPARKARAASKSRRAGRPSATKKLRRPKASRRQPPTLTRRGASRRR